MSADSEVTEEYVDGQPTGIEAEESDPEDGEGGRSSVINPWNPDEIRVHTRTYSLRNLMDMIDDGDIDLAPDFQRNFVWKDKQKWALIESLLLGIPLPSFYLNEDKAGHLQVVDGLQRLTTIHQFMRGNSFKLGPMQYLQAWQNLDFKGLDPSEKRRLNSTQFVAHVIDPNTPYKVKFDIFRRLNTGGSPLSAAEIRHCMSSDESRRLLKSLVESPAFVDATGGSLKNNTRMADREVVLRFIAFRRFSLDDYARLEADGGLDNFLGETINDLDGLKPKARETETAQLTADFVRGMENAKVVFGDWAFRRWPETSERRMPINRALVEVWALALSRYERKALTAAKVSTLVKKARKMMTSDAAFIGAISRSTSDPAQVRLRFERVNTLVAAVLG